MYLLLTVKSISSLIAMFLVFDVGNIQAQEPSKKVNVLKYVRAKTAFHFDRVLMRCGSIDILRYDHHPALHLPSSIFHLPPLAQKVHDV
jgi:hypothetical protein